MNFKYKKNPDGSFEVFNNEIGDIYFSNIGAYQEALEKFVLPSFPLPVKNNKIKILDVCYGMGYNSKTFVDYCIKNNIDYEFEIDCIDIDTDILVLGTLIFDKNISDNVHFIFGQEILENTNYEFSLKNIFTEEWGNYILNDLILKFNEFLPKNITYLSSQYKISSFLHNIYYQNRIKSEPFTHKIKLKFLLGDLRELLLKLDNNYDLIFHDAFSIRKQPELWSEEIMSNYYRLLNTNGKLLTYSNSRVLRRILDEINFEVKINYDKFEKQNGTIAIKA